MSDEIVTAVPYCHGGNYGPATDSQKQASEMRINVFNCNRQFKFTDGDKLNFQKWSLAMNIIL